MWGHDLVDMTPAPVDVLPRQELPYKVPPTTLPLEVERFIQEYVICGSAGKAYRAVFGEARSKNPASSGRDLLSRPDVIVRLRMHQHAIAAMSVKTTDTLIRELEEIVEADVSELIRITFGACRYCWGVGGFYQWRDMAEYEKAVKVAVELGKATPDCTGGFQYRFTAGVNENCAVCEGQGIQRIVVADTETLSPGARRLYKGLECNPDGTVKKLLMHDQLAARAELHRIRGMHVERSLQLSLSATLPDAKEIAASPERVNDFLEGLKT